MKDEPKEEEEKKKEDKQEEKTESGKICLLQSSKERLRRRLKEKVIVEMRCTQLNWEQLLNDGLVPEAELSGEFGFE